MRHHEDSGGLQLEDSGVDEVDVAARGESVLLAWASASLDRESLHVARLEGGALLARRELPGEEAHRPRLAPAPSGWWLAAPARREVRSLVVLWHLDEDLEARELTRLDFGGHHARLALASSGDQAWLAVECWREGTPAIHLGRVSADGAFHPLALPASEGAWRRCPALTASAEGAWLAWSEGPPRSAGQIRLWRVDDAEGSVTVWPEAAHQEAPALALDAQARPLVAWHGGGRSSGFEDALRWLRLVRLRADGGFEDLSPPRAPDLARHEAEEDQGWEFPAVAAGEDGGIWLVGRSSGGFHAAFREPGGAWRVRQRLSSPRWGGRGGRAALAAGHVAHGEPEGLLWQALRPGPPAVADPTQRATPRYPTSTPRVPPGPWFGDLHHHSMLSDGLGSPEELLRGARELRGHDFVALTDHDQFCQRAVGPLTWAHLRAVVAAFDEPGRFVPLLGYEFTGSRHPGPGHKCVYFGAEVPARLPGRDPAALAALLATTDAFAIPHHVGWTGSDREHHDPVRQPLWEICSNHGVYEELGQETAFPPRPDVVLPGHFVRDALEAGLRFGFVGGTDAHGLLWHHGVGHRRDPYRAGLTGLRAPALTREEVLAALRARRCWATTGARIDLDLELEGAPMGSALPADTRGALRVQVRGTAPLRRVTLVRRGREQPLEGIEGAGCEISLPLSLPAELDWDYLYLRVVQKDGEMAWSSPQWLGAPT